MTDAPTIAPQTSDIKLDPSWKAALAGEFAKPYMQSLKAFLQDRRTQGAQQQARAHALARQQKHGRDHQGRGQRPQRKQRSRRQQHMAEHIENAVNEGGEHGRHRTAIYPNGVAIGLNSRNSRPPVGGLASATARPSSCEEPCGA